MKKTIRIQMIAALLASAATRWATHVQAAAQNLSKRWGGYTRSRRGIHTGHKRAGNGKSLRRCTFGHNKSPHFNGMIAVARRPVLLTLREKVGKVGAFRMVFPKGTYFFRKTPAVLVERKNGGWTPIIPHQKAVAA